MIPFGIRANFDSRTSRREQLGLTLRELATRSGVSSSMISDIERGAKSPTLSTLSALVQALGVSMSALLDSASPKSGRIHVVRASERPELVDPISRARRDHFGPTLAGSKVEFLRYAVPPLTLAGPFAPIRAGRSNTCISPPAASGPYSGPMRSCLQLATAARGLADVPHHFDNRESEVEALIYIVVERP